MPLLSNYTLTSCPGRRSGTPLNGSAGWRPTTTPSSSRVARRSPNGCSGHTAGPSSTAWGMLASYVSSTAMAPSATSLLTPRSTRHSSRHSCWRPPDFRTFVVSQLSGPFATNKGLALFPRKVGGRYVVLSRWDREHLAVTVSDNDSEWAEATTLRWAPRPWEVVQVGNCASPLETPEGWLVLTHGVGPVRTYALGAILQRPRRPPPRARNAPGPLLVADEDEREGYVPNVVYSCGALVHGQTLVLLYGFSDSADGFALVDAELLGRLSG